MYNVIIENILFFTNNSCDWLNICLAFCYRPSKKLIRKKKKEFSRAVFKQNNGIMQKYWVLPNGIKHGWFVSYYDCYPLENMIHISANYKQGKKHGFYYRYYKTGKIEMWAEYFNGKKMNSFYMEKKR